MQNTAVHTRLRLVALAVAAACVVTAGARISAQRGAVAGAPLVLDGTSTILLGADEAPAVAAAVDDLAADMERVLGRKPRVVRRPEDAGTATIVVGYRSTVVAGLRPAAAGDPESFSISVKRTGWKTGPSRAVLLTGADMRGTIYSVYEFSSTYLGVDPLYYWTDHVPARKDRVEIAATLSQAFRAPVFNTAASSSTTKIC